MRVGRGCNSDLEHAGMMLEKYNQDVNIMTRDGHYVIFTSGIFFLVMIFYWWKFKIFTDIKVFFRMNSYKQVWKKRAFLFILKILLYFLLEMLLQFCICFLKLQYKLNCFSHLHKYFLPSCFDSIWCFNLSLYEAW